MANTNYRVVLTGAWSDGYSREAVIAGLSRFFERSAAEIARAMQTGECQVGPATTADDALTLQQRLEATGARVRVDRLGQDAAPLSAQLNLPAGGDPMAAGLMHCPACGHQQLVAKSCDECGVVFAEYNRQHPGAAPRRPERSSAAIPPATTAATAAPLHRKVRQNDWLDDGDDAPDENYHLKLFMGMDAEHLVGPCERMTVGRRVVFRPSWAWGAVVSPFLWALNRRMLGWSSLIFIVEVFIPVLLIMLGSKEGISDKFTYLGIALLVLNRLFWPAVLKPLYCRHARGMIDYLNRMSPTSASDIDVATRGGTSRTSVFAGIVVSIVVLMLTWSIVDALHEAMIESRPVFVAPPSLPVPASPTTPAPNTATPSLEDDLLVNENKWVATRNKLRVFGQQVNTWLLNSGASVDPAVLDIGQIATSLAAGDEPITDGWENRFRYESDGNGFRLISAGPDGEFETSDDVEYRRLLQR